MLFNSLDFAVFLPIVFFLYWFVAQKNLRFQNALIVLASYFFYGWWDWRFLSLIIFSTIVDYLVALKLSKEKQKSKRKILLWTSIIVNLGFLGFFKYYNFFLETFIDAFSFFGTQINANSLNVILPVGISFYTFQTLSYTIDIYKKKLQPTEDFIAFSAFVCFFPQLVAGPIERAANLLPQFSKAKKFKFIYFQFGFIRILWGLFKKVVIADRLAIAVDVVFNNPENYGGLSIMIATLFFAFQIYCDFSGYSDIAIGTARMFNIKLRENFRTPYFSKSLNEFWQRWHISLSSWFRDYLYIPLGGNRVSKLRWHSNIIIVFTVSGLWHGANLTFLIWGIIHGLILIIENILKTINLKVTFSSKKIINIFSLMITFLFVCFAWVFFRANTAIDSIIIIQNIFDFTKPIYETSVNGSIQKLLLGLPLWKFIGSFLLILILIIFEYFIYKNIINDIILVRKKTIYRWIYYITIILVILIFGYFDNNQFIYFQF